MLTINLDGREEIFSHKQKNCPMLLVDPTKQVGDKFERGVTTDLLLAAMLLKNRVQLRVKPNQRQILFKLYLTMKVVFVLALVDD